MKIVNSKRKLLVLYCILLTFVLFVSLGLSKAKAVTKNDNIIQTIDVGKNIFINSLEDISINKKEVYTQEWLDEYFKGLDGSQKVIELPNGGFIGTYTETPGVPDATITDENGNIIEYDVDTDPNAETVDQVKARLLNQPMRGD